MIAFRKAHPSLARSRFWREDVRWFGPRGVPDFAQPVVALLLRGASQHDTDLYVMINGGPADVTFVVQDVADGWSIVVDTALPSPEDIELARPRPLARPSCTVAARSIVVLMRA